MSKHSEEGIMSYLYTVKHNFMFDKECVLSSDQKSQLLSQIRASIMSLCQMSGIYWNVCFYFHIYLSLKYFQTKPSVAPNA